MRIFKIKAFHKWAVKIDLDEPVLREIVDEMVDGQYGISLGGYLYKKRVAVDGKGKRGSLRTIIAFKREDKAFFIYGFAKNRQENITEQEEKALKELARIYFSYDEKQMRRAVEIKEFIEVQYDG